MPARPAVANTIKAEVLMTCDAIPLANIFHVGYSSTAPTATDLTSLAEAIASVYESYWMTEVGSYYTLAEVICTDIASDSGLVGTASPASPGALSGGPISSGSAVLVNWQIGRRYRGGKPRTYLPPSPASGILSPSEWNSAVVSAAGTWATHLESACYAVTYGALVTTSLGCVSYRNADTARVDPLFEPFLGHSVGPLIRSQRRRITASSF